MQGNQGQIVCADLLDQDGAVNTGIVTLDNGNDELGLTDSQYSSWLDYCLKGDPNTP